MTNEELQQLSRDAAKVLLAEHGVLFQALDLMTTGRMGQDGAHFGEWLHESTEACAEIMVRVLWPLAVAARLEVENHGKDRFITVEAGMARVKVGDDPMQAFRTAVLRALIEVKK